MHIELQVNQTELTFVVRAPQPLKRSSTRQLPRATPHLKDNGPQQRSRRISTGLGHPEARWGEEASGTPLGTLGLYTPAARQRCPRPTLPASPLRRPWAFLPVSHAQPTRPGQATHAQLAQAPWASWFFGLDSGSSARASAFCSAIAHDQGGGSRQQAVRAVWECSRC